MRIVIIESPYAGDIEANEAYLESCIKDSFSRGEAPLASHGFYTRYLDDTDTEQRKLGMACGFIWMQVCDLVAVYIDRGISQGMFQGIQQAKAYGKTIDIRSLSEISKPSARPWIPKELPVRKIPIKLKA